MLRFSFLRAAFVFQTGGSLAVFRFRGLTSVAAAAIIETTPKKMFSVDVKSFPEHSKSVPQALAVTQFSSQTFPSENLQGNRAERILFRKFELLSELLTLTGSKYFSW